MYKIARPKRAKAPTRLTLYDQKSRKIVSKKIQYIVFYELFFLAY